MIKKNIAIITTTPIAVKSNLGSIIEYLKKDYSVIVMTNMSNKGDKFLEGLPSKLRFFDTKMERKIKIFKDLRSLFLILNFFRKEDISLVYTMTPKAGLLGNLASFISGIPVRVHAFTGQVWQTKYGLFRFVLKTLDRVIYLCSSKVIVDSNSQRDFLIKNKVINKKDSVVLGSGSLCGVDLDKFFPNFDAKKLIRKELNVPMKNIVFLFVGRLNKEKGIEELLEAYILLANKIENSSLWLLGSDEMEIEKYLSSIKSLKIRNSIHFLPFTSFPEKYMASADIFCLPSYREGFGTVIIESAACGIPSIGSKIDGLKDSIIDNETGLLTELKNTSDLLNAMHTLADDKVLREKMGERARLRTYNLYDQKIVIPALINFLGQELNK